MNHLRHVMSCFLAVGLALAGVVGLHPALHRWAEHGGQGPAHTHDGGFAHPEGLGPHGQETPQGSSHSHDGASADAWRHHREHAPTSARALDPSHGWLSHCHGPFSPPTAALAKLWRSLSGWLAGPGQSDSEPAPSGEAPSHHHHSLAQSLVGGLVEQAPSLPILHFEPGAGFVPPLPAETILLPKGFDPQSASRGPPVPRG